MNYWANVSHIFHSYFRVISALSTSCHTLSLQNANPFPPTQHLPLDRPVEALLSQMLTQLSLIHTLTEGHNLKVHPPNPLRHPPHLAIHIPILEPSNQVPLRNRNPFQHPLLDLHQLLRRNRAHHRRDAVEDA